MVQAPLIGKAGLGVDIGGMVEDLSQCATGPGSSVECSVYLGHCLRLASQFVRQGSEVNQTSNRANQPPPTSTQHQHGIAVQLLPGGQRMPEGEDPLIRSDEVHDALHTAAFRLLCQYPGDLIFSLSRADGTYGAVHRLGMQLAQCADTFLLLRREQGSHTGQLGGEVDRVRIGYVRSNPEPIGQISHNGARLIPRGDPKLPTLIHQPFLQIQSGSLNVVDDQIATFRRDDQCGFALCGSHVDVGGRAAGGPGETANAP